MASPLKGQNAEAGSKGFYAGGTSFVQDGIQYDTVYGGYGLGTSYFGTESRTIGYAKARNPNPINLEGYSLDVQFSPSGFGVAISFGFNIG